MNRASLNASSFNRKQKSTPASTLKVIEFRIGDLNLAIPITSIYKILKQTRIEGSGVHSVSVAHLGDQELTVIDLQRQLFHESAIKNQGQDNHLIVLRTATGELCGIPVEQVPVLVDIPLASLRVLPASYRRADTLGIASHVAVISQTGSTHTVFLLEVGQLLSLSVG